VGIQLKERTRNTTMSSKLVNIGESAPKILSVVPVVPVVPFRAGPSLVNLSSIRLVKRRTIFSSKASNHAKDTEVGNKKEEKKAPKKVVTNSNITHTAKAVKKEATEARVKPWEKLHYSYRPI
jgi:hypothetical protein